MNCKKCGCEIDSCCKYCDSCAYLVDLENKRKRQQMNRQRYEELGTRNFSNKMLRHSNKTPNFSGEHRAILKELRDLGVRKDGTSKPTKK